MVAFWPATVCVPSGAVVESPKLATTTSRTLSPVTSTSPTHDELCPAVENGVPTSDKLPAPSLRNTDTEPVFCRFTLTATKSCQPSPLMSPIAAKLTFWPPVLRLTRLNPPPDLPYRMV